MNVIDKRTGGRSAKSTPTRAARGLVDSFEQIVIEEEAPVADEATVLVTRAGFVQPLCPHGPRKRRWRAPNRRARSST